MKSPVGQQPVDGVAPIDVEEVEEVAELGHGTLDDAGRATVFGAGSMVRGLMPPGSISVAPSGTLLPTTLVLEMAAAVGGAALLNAEEQPVGLKPPPSNVPAVDDPVVAAPAGSHDGFGAGLRPPTLSSVDPSGMVVELVPLASAAPGMPRGDDVSTLCALAACSAQTAARAANVLVHMDFHSS